ncbi:MAG: caspase family protein [Nitrospinae bacterium]|nr:caspase family protein [Nitrospinota bacterium]
MKIIGIAFLFSLSNLFSPFPSEAARRALLVGINQYKNLPYYSKKQGKWITDLKGPLNDIRIMKQILISRYGFLEEEIWLLRDQEATWDNILKKLR